MKTVRLSAVRTSPELRPSISPWCDSPWKAAWDLSCAVWLLVILALPILGLSLMVKLTSPGPIFFQQRRRGKGGREFVIFKFRTMIVNGHEAGPLLTKAKDPRVTWFGRHMRRWKLDELPQLFNVLRGEMSFVGPRPQVSRFWREPWIRERAPVVLSVRPGITSEATLMFRNEESVLASLSSDEVEGVYARTLMPLKMKMETEYLVRASFLSDLRIMLQTVARIFIHPKENDAFLSRHLSVSDASGQELDGICTEESA